MGLPYYLLMTPIAFIFIGIGVLGYFNKVDIRGYGLEEFIHNVDEQKRENETRFNKVIGIISIAVGIVVLVFGLFV